MYRIIIVFFALSVLPLRAAADFLPFDYDFPLQAYAPARDRREAPVPAASGPLTVPAEWGIRIFQVFVSPQDGPSCMYSPTCSRYGLISLRRYGFITGLLMTGDRWLRCNPFGYPGDDLPEENYFGRPR